MKSPNITEAAGLLDIPLVKILTNVMSNEQSLMDIIISLNADIVDMLDRLDKLEGKKLNKYNRYE